MAYLLAFDFHAVYLTLNRMTFCKVSHTNEFVNLFMKANDDVTFSGSGECVMGNCFAIS